MSRGDDSRTGGQDFCVPATITKERTSHERIRGRAKVCRKYEKQKRLEK